MNKISKGKSKAKKVIIAILAIIAALFVLMLSIAACSGSGDSGNAKIYSDAVQKICAGEYDEAYNELGGITDYKDAEEIAKYALLVKNFNEKDYKNYEGALEKLDAIKNFEDSGLKSDREKFKEKINLLIKKRDEDYAKAKALDEEIDGLGDVMLSDKEKVTSLQKQYNESSYIVKEQVQNVSKLQEANAKITSIEENRQKAKSAEEKINAIGSVSLESKSAIESARSEYDSLPDEAKEYVLNKGVLAKAESDYNNLLKKEQTEKITTTKKSSKTSENGGNKNSVTHQNNSRTVYWVKNGEVYHVSETCPTLSRSKKIYSGTISQSGKSCACKVCS